MPVVVMIKGKDKTYLFTDNCQYLSSAKLIKKAPRQYHIQKFKNFVLAYNGDAPVFSKFIKQFDIDSFPESLTKSYLMRHFYMDFLNFLADETDAKLENGSLMDSPFGIMIMGKNYAFDIGDEYLYEVDECNAMGDDKLVFNLYEDFKDKYSDEEMIKLIMDKCDKYGYSISYPYIMVTNDDLDHLKVIQRDGSVTVESLKEYWRKD